MSLWPLYVILYGLCAGAGVITSIVIAITWITLRDAVRLSA